MKDNLVKRKYLSTLICTLVISLLLSISLSGCKNFGEELRRILRGAAQDPSGKSGAGEKKPDSREDLELAEKNSIKSCPEGATFAGAPYPKGTLQWCELTTPDGKKVKHGELKQWNRDGDLLLSANYENGQYHGKMIKYFTKSGKPLQEANYKNGLLDGPVTDYYRHGAKKMLTTYRAGRKNGAYATWTKKGKPKHKGSYYEDLKNNLWTTYNKKGGIVSEISYANDKRNGKAKFYNKDGQLSAVESYRADIPEGRWQLFYKNAGKKEEGYYVAGQKHGEWLTFSKDGIVTSKTVFNNGMIVQSESFAQAPGVIGSNRLRGHVSFSNSDVMGAPPPVRRQDRQKQPAPEKLRPLEKREGWSPL